MLKLPRTERGRYYGAGTSHTFLIVRDARRGWLLTIAHARTVAGVKISDTSRRLVADESPHDTLGLARGIARHFEALGEDYDSAAHGHRERITEAIIRAYADDEAAAAVAR
jgi:hypothetical protein